MKLEIFSFNRLFKISLFSDRRSRQYRHVASDRPIAGLTDIQTHRQTLPSVDLDSFIDLETVSNVMLTSEGQGSLCYLAGTTGEYNADCDVVC